MDNIDLKSIGERISRQRKLIGMTQERLAEEMDVSIQMISNLERGVKAIRIDNLVKLSRILGVTTDYILTGDTAEAYANTLSRQIAQLSARNYRLIEVIISQLLHENE